MFFIMENSILYPIDVLFNTSLAVFFICILSGFAFYKLGKKYLTPKNFEEERIVLAESENKIRLRRNISLYVIFSFIEGLLLTIPAALHHLNTQTFLLILWDLILSQFLT